MARSSQSLTARRFWRAAEKRLYEAQFLFKADFHTASVYLAGYAIECLLKALILSSEPSRQHEETLASFRGNKAHAYRWLIGQLRLRRNVPPPEMIEMFNEADWWSTDLRYEPADLDELTAKTFLTSATKVMVWAKGRLS